MERKIYNPIQRDQVIFLKTHADTDGEYTLAEVELADGGGVGLHIIKPMRKNFRVLTVKCRLNRVNLYIS